MFGAKSYNGITGMLPQNILKIIFSKLYCHSHKRLFKVSFSKGKQGKQEP